MTFADFWGWINFPLGLLVAEFILSMRLPKRKCFWLFLIIGCVPSVVMSLLWRYIPINGLWGGTMIFFAIFILTMIMPIAAYKANVWSYLFVGIIAYSAQHIYYETYNIINTLANHMPLWAQIIVLIAISAVYYTALYFAFTKRRNKGELITVDNRVLLLVAGMVLTVTVVISFFGGAYAGMSGLNNLVIIIRLFSIITCLLSLFMGYFMCSAKKNQIELAVVKQMLYVSQKQYEESKESIDIINVKCHDLKHQLSGLKGKLDQEELSRVTEAIAIYDNSFKTGNAALDVVLTEKGLICKNKGIRLTCMLDGSSLDGITQSDIYSLFGNALDNAINGVSAEDENNRVISIREIKRGGFSIITVENYHTEEIVFEDGLPLTTNADKDYHGFGMKSMKMITEKYGGELMVSFADNIFKLQMILAHK